MLRKIILMICIAFIVVCYGYPCLVLPFGDYQCNYTDPISGDKIEVTMQFKFGGKLIIDDDEGFYKQSGNKIIISEDETFDDEDLTIKLNNMYTFDFALLPGMSMTFKNNIGMYAAIGVGVLSVILVLTAPSKKY